MLLIHIIQDQHGMEMFFTPKMNSAKGQTAFVYSGAHMWNNLPSHFKEAQSIDIFKERLKEHILTNDLTW